MISMMDENTRNIMVTGQVIQGVSGTGRPGLTVAAVPSGQFNQAGAGIPTQIGTATTDANGRFSINLNANQFFNNSLSNVYFNVYDGQTLLNSTEGYVIWNANTQEDVTIKLSDAVVPTGGKNRMTAVQGRSIGKFVAQSDFTGLFTQTKSQAGTAFSVLGDAIVNSISKVNLTPIQVPVQNTKIVNADLPTATRHLNDNNVSYTVMDYNPALNKDLLTAATNYQTNLKPGQTVNLYQQNGVVKYYSIVQDTPATAQTSTPAPATPSTPTPAPSAVSDANSAQIAQLQLELANTKQDAANKDAQIASLNEQLAAIQKDQANIKQILQSKLIL